MSSKSAHRVGSKSNEVDLRDLEVDENKHLNFAPAPKEKVNFPLDIREYHKHTDKQKEVLGKMMDRDTKMVLLNSIWGSSKSYCAALSALHLLKRGDIRKIYYIRNPVEASMSATVGTLPGELNTRLEMYNAILKEKFAEFLPISQVNRLIQEGYVEFIPPGLIRGRNFSKSLLWGEEVGDWSFEDFCLVSSRMAEGSRAFLVGDSFQSSIRNSGLEKFYEMFDDEESRNEKIYCYSWRDPEDILRGGFVKYLMKKVGKI